MLHFKMIVLLKLFDLNRFLEVYQEATDVYGLIHARFITSPKGYHILYKYCLIFINIISSLLLTVDMNSIYLLLNIID